MEPTMTEWGQGAAIAVEVLAVEPGGLPLRLEPRPDLGIEDWTVILRAGVRAPMPLGLYPQGWGWRRGPSFPMEAHG